MFQVACDPKDELIRYSKESLTGDKTIYQTDTPSAKPGENTCHSIDVEYGEWLVYTHDRYQGTTVLLKPGIHPTDESIAANTRGFGGWNGQARSVRPVRRNAITLFDKFAYAGASKSFRGEYDNVSMQDCRSFIIRDGWWQLYPLGGYKGEYPYTTGLFGPGEYNMQEIFPGIESMVVGSLKPKKCPWPWPCKQ
ncbi:gamma-crystallin M1-1-like [Branchiostoma floridae x Branchiostoma belcheri]